MRSVCTAVICGLCFLSLAACGGGPTTMGGGGGSGSGSGGGNPGSSDEISHVAIVVLENQNYSDVVGSASMPYLNQLAQQGGLATQFYANVHPSIGNYFMMTTGQVVDTNDAFTGVFSGNNVTTSLMAASKSWKAYAESLPEAGYVGGDQ